jgi:phage shock protein A
MMTSEDIARVKKGPADLEERIEQLEKQKEILKAACKKAGARIKELDNSLSIALDINDKYQRENKKLTDQVRDAEGETSIVKAVGLNSPEMKTLQKEIEELKADLARAKEDHQYDNLVHKNELEKLSKKPF